MAERTTIQANWGYYDFVLKSGVSAERGNIAAIDTSDGSITNPGPGTGFVPIGIFQRSVTGDGTVTVQVKLWFEIRAYWFDNDAAGTPVVIAKRGQLCYLKDSHTVTSVATGSVAGMVLDVNTTKGVLVLFSYKAF